MTIKDQLNTIAACLDDLASGTLSGETLIQEQIAAREHAAKLYKLADAVQEVKVALQLAIEIIEGEYPADDVIAAPALLKMRVALTKIH